MSYLKYFLSVLMLSLSTSAFADQTPTSDACCIPEEEQTRLMGLSYNDFDQSMHAGWRKIAEDQGCYQAGAQIVDRYREAHQTTLKDWERNILVWHAGQMLGFDGNSVQARVRFVASLDPQEPADAPILWNDYVFASIAFLDHDLETLKAHRERIARGPTFQGKKMNLNVVDNLIQGFDSPYIIAYPGPLYHAVPATHCPNPSPGTQTPR